MLQPLLIGGERHYSKVVRAVCAPYDGQTVGEVCYAEAPHIEAVIAHQPKAQQVAQTLTTAERYAILDRLYKRLEAEADALARLIATEAGKPLRYAQLEVKRALLTTSMGRDLVRTLEGEVLPGDVLEGLNGRVVLARRVPIGPLLAITPFNFPLNLVLHKVVPAVVVGTAITLKPAPQAPLTAYWLAQALLEAGWPPLALSVVLAEVPLAEQLVRSSAFRILSFTGSAAVGWHLQTLAYQKKVLLELGGSAAVIVDEAPDLAAAASAISEAAYLYSGQVCISVQRILVRRALYDDFIAAYREATAKLVAGDPLDPQTHYSALIDKRAMERIQSWLTEARLGGAEDLLPFRVEGSIMHPVLLRGVPSTVALAREEAFAPYAEVAPYDDFAQALARVNASPYGLQAGVYTPNATYLKEAWAKLEVGGVVHNAPPTLRLDHMPYGGVKGSGLGREGVKYAALAYTEPKALLW